MKRILCLDVGEKRVGVAVSDPLGYTAQGVETIQSKGAKKDLSQILELSKRYETDRVLIGLPMSMDGSVGAQAEQTLKYAQGLIEAGLNVRYQDERLTTALARRTLIEGDVSRKKRKGVVDKLAAVYILQSYMDAGGWKE